MLLPEIKRSLSRILFFILMMYSSNPEGWIFIIYFQMFSSAFKYTMLIATSDIFYVKPHSHWYTDPYTHVKGRLHLRGIHMCSVMICAGSLLRIMIGG